MGTEKYGFGRSGVNHSAFIVLPHRPVVRSHRSFKWFASFMDHSKLTGPGLYPCLIRVPSVAKCSSSLPSNLDPLTSNLDLPRRHRRAYATPLAIINP
jgi:hypothetical protein